MVKLSLRIRGINKFAVNNKGLTALDIVRENTQYHESDKIIAALANYPSKRKPFLYSSPNVSAEKHEVAIQTVDKTFEDRRNTELVVAVLLATMAFTAAFTIPGGFVGDGKPKEEGSPLLLGLDSFNLFLIFDCVAFFLSLLVVLMWQMSTLITTGDKVAYCSSVSPTCWFAPPLPLRRMVSWPQCMPCLTARLASWVGSFLGRACSFAAVVSSLFSTWLQPFP